MSTTERILPALMAVVYGAALIATWGFTSLALDTDVIREKDASLLLGPSMAAGAVLVTLAWLLRLRPRLGSRPWGSVVLAAVSVWLVMLVVGAIGYAATRGELAWVLLFVGRYAPSPFVLLPAVLAGIVVVVTFMLAGRSPAARSFDRR